MASRHSAALAASVLLAVGLVVPAAAAGPTTRLVSKAANGDPAASSTDFSAISGDGSVAAFTSNADNLPQGDGPATQVYARDTDAAKTLLVSRTSDGDVGDDISGEPWLSTSGRFVAFGSRASNLPDGDGSTQRMYVHDLKTRTTRLLSKNSDGEVANENAYPAGLSANGRFAAFRSAGENLPGAAAIDVGLYVHDRTTGKTRLVSKTSDGTPVEPDSTQISSDGDHVVFSSQSSDLPAGDGSTYRIYMRDLKAGTTKLVSKNSQGDVANEGCGYGSVASDGSVVAFTCQATNLPGGDGTTPLVYARDLDAGTTRLVSRNQGGDPAEDSAYDPFLSGNGRVVSFYTDSDNLPGTDGEFDVYTFDLRTGKLRVVSRNSEGELTDEFAETYPPALSRDGSYVVFRSSGSNLPGGNGTTTQLYLRGPLD